MKKTFVKTAVLTATTLSLGTVVLPAAAHANPNLPYTHTAAGRKLESYLAEYKTESAELPKLRKEVYALEADVNNARNAKSKLGVALDEAKAAYAKSADALKKAQQEAKDASENLTAVEKAYENGKKAANNKYASAVKAAEAAHNSRLKALQAEMNNLNTKLNNEKAAVEAAKEALQTAREALEAQTANGAAAPSYQKAFENASAKVESAEEVVRTTEAAKTKLTESNAKKVTASEATKDAEIKKANETKNDELHVLEYNYIEKEGYKVEAAIPVAKKRLADAQQSLTNAVEAEKNDKNTLVKAEAAFKAAEKNVIITESKLLNAQSVLLNQEVKVQDVLAKVYTLTGGKIQDVNVDVQGLTKDQKEELQRVFGQTSQEVEQGLKEVKEKAAQTQAKADAVSQQAKAAEAELAATSTEATSTEATSTEATSTEATSKAADKKVANKNNLPSTGSISMIFATSAGVLSAIAGIALSVFKKRK